MSHTERVLRSAKRYTRRGWAVVPIPVRKKKPHLTGWPDLRLKESDLPEYFSNDCNIGIILGEASGNLYDVDLDCPEALTLADTFLPYTDRVHGRHSAPLSHRWYVSDAVLSPDKFSDPDGTCLLEFRANGQQTVVPPSIHESGERIRWESKGEPERIDGTELREALGNLAAATLFARHWPSKGTRNEVALALAGTLLRAGREDIEVGEFVAAVARAAGDEEWASRKATARATRKRLDKDAPATGRQRLAELLGAKIVDQACSWLGFGTALHQPFPRLRQQQVPWPEPLADEAFYGLPGEIVRALAPETEADPAALLVQLLVGHGNLIGRSAHFVIGATRHYANFNAALVGQTAKARKGTSWSEVRRLLRDVDSDWAQNRMMPGGLSSGEGLIWTVRDPQEKPKNRKGKKGKETAPTDAETTIEEALEREASESGDQDQGVDDKRLLVVEPEFAATLRVMRREGNILSAVIRNAWDSGDLNNLTKNSPARATGAHVSIIVHITQDELRRELTVTDSANGFANRFLWLCVRRARLLPFGGNLDTSTLNQLVRRLRSAAAFGRTAPELRMSKQARKLWRAKYPELAAEVPGLLGAITSRAEPQVLRLAIVYALLDCSRFIRTGHLAAALALWRYCEDSARYIFGDALGDPVADPLLRELRQNPSGLTRTEIREFFKRNRSEAEISRALSFLLENGWVSCSQEQTGGRPSERWVATQQGTP